MCKGAKSTELSDMHLIGRVAIFRYTALDVLFVDSVMFRLNTGAVIRVYVVENNVRHSMLILSAFSLSPVFHTCSIGVSILLHIKEIHFVHIQHSFTVDRQNINCAQ